MATTNKHDAYPISTFKDSKALEKWMKKNHGKAEGLWVKIAKASTGIKSITHSDALDLALCYGWIDGLRRRLDDQYFLQKFTPRTSSSTWSVINQQKVATLIKEGRMQPGGLAAIEAAKKNGRWESAYKSQKTIEVPADLQESLDNNKKAKTFFSKLSSQNRFAILFRIGKVKRPDTRARKIEEFVKMLQENRTIYPQK